jgi:hypothetical protein
MLRSWGKEVRAHYAALADRRHSIEPIYPGAVSPASAAIRSEITVSQFALDSMTLFADLAAADTIVKVPQMAESITEGTLKQFSKRRSLDPSPNL